MNKEEYKITATIDSSVLKLEDFIPEAKVYSIEKNRQDKKNAGMPWTEEDDDRLQGMISKLVPPREIARLMGRTIGAIKARMEKLEDREYYNDFE